MLAFLYLSTFLGYFFFFFIGGVRLARLRRSKQSIIPDELLRTPYSSNKCHVGAGHNSVELASPTLKYELDDYYSFAMHNI